MTIPNVLFVGTTGQAATDSLYLFKYVPGGASVTTEYTETPTPQTVPHWFENSVALRSFGETSVLVLNNHDDNQFEVKVFTGTTLTRTTAIANTYPYSETDLTNKSLVMISESEFYLLIGLPLISGGSFTDLYSYHTTDGGATFDNALIIRLGYPSAQIAVMGSKLYVLCMSNADDNYHLYTSTLGLNAWSDLGIISTLPSSSFWFADLASHNSNLYIQGVWYDDDTGDSFGGIWELTVDDPTTMSLLHTVSGYYDFLDGGFAFQGPARLHAVFTISDGVGGPATALFLESLDGGATWADTEILTLQSWNHVAGWISLENHNDEYLIYTSLDLGASATLPTTTPTSFFISSDHGYTFQEITTPLGDTITWNTCPQAVCFSSQNTPSASCTSISNVFLDPSTMLITGTGIGADATEWRIIRTADSAIMDSGLGLTPTFSFIGQYEVQYQLQFK
jgi:hypothetical protein